MNSNKKPKRYTLSLPENVHRDLVRMADQQEISAKEIVIKCLKLGLIAFNVNDSPDKELILREKLYSGEVKETQLILI